MVTTKEKPSVDTQKIKRRKSKHTPIQNYQFTKKDRNTGRKEHGPENNKMTLVSPHLSITTLNVNGLNSPVKRHRIAEWKKKR